MNSRPTSGVPGSRRATRLSNCDVRDFSFAGMSIVGASGELISVSALAGGTASNSVAGSGSVAVSTRGLLSVPENDSSSSSGGPCRSAVVVGRTRRAGAAPVDSSAGNASGNAAIGSWNSARIGSSASPAAAGVTGYDGSDFFSQSTNSYAAAATSHNIPATACSTSLGVSVQLACKPVSATQGVLHTGVHNSSSAGTMQSPQLAPLKATYTCTSASGGSVGGGVMLLTRPASAGPDKSRPGSAASTSRLKASARGEVW